MRALAGYGDIMIEVRQCSMLVQRSLKSRSAEFFESTRTRLIRMRALTLQRCLMAQSRCSKPLVFGQETALKLMCVEVPSEIDTDEITVVVPRPSDRPRLEGVRAMVWSHELPTTTIDGITCVAPSMVWIMCARKAGLREMVLLGDALMRRDTELKWYSIGQLKSEFVNFIQAAGVGDRSRFQTCAQALKLVRENTDSFPETLLRLTLMQHGLPCPQVNYCLELSSGIESRGEQLFLDLAYPQARVAVEYDGQQHAWQWNHDRRRLKTIGDAHWAHVAVRGEDLRSEESRSELTASVVDRLECQLGRRIRLGKFLSLPRLAAADRRLGSDLL